MLVLKKLAFSMVLNKGITYERVRSQRGILSSKFRTGNVRTVSTTSLLDCSIVSKLRFALRCCQCAVSFKVDTGKFVIQIFS